MGIRNSVARTALFTGVTVTAVVGAGLWVWTASTARTNPSPLLSVTGVTHAGGQPADWPFDQGPLVAQLNKDPRVSPGTLWPAPPEPRLDLHEQSILVYAPHAWESTAGKSLLDAGLVPGPHAIDLVVGDITVERTRDWHVLGAEGDFIGPGSVRVQSIPQMCRGGMSSTRALTIPSADETKLEWASCVTIGDERQGAVAILWRTEWKADVPVRVQGRAGEPGPTVRRHTSGDTEGTHHLREGESIVRYIPFPENNDIGHVQVLTRPGREELIGVHVYAAPAHTAIEAAGESAEPLDAPAEGWLAMVVAGDDARAVAGSLDQDLRKEDRVLLAAKEFSGWRDGSRSWSSESASGVKVVSAHDMIPFPHPRLYLLLEGAQFQLPLAPNQIILLVPPPAGGEPEEHESVYLVVFRGHAAGEQ